jgi:cytochrome c oxidase cbb3-type subunit 2
MTRTSLLMIGALATVAFATIVLVFLPRTMLATIERPPIRGYYPDELRGRQVYIENGCVYCHSQQVRDPAFTTDMDRGWGSRPNVPSDYYFDRPHLLGTMRTGPDLINVGQRLPDADWHLIHLYNPRAVVQWSIMPAFPFLFEVKGPQEVGLGERVVPVPPAFAPGRKEVIVASPDALALTAYLMTLKRNHPAAVPGTNMRH